MALISSYVNYNKIYKSLISHRQVNQLDKTIYTEKHHITPKCLGGNNDPANLVKLTAREHFIAHQLLCKIHKNHPPYILQKLASAFNRMCTSNHPKRNFTSRQFAIARRMFSENHPCKNPNTVEKIKKTHLLNKEKNTQKRKERKENNKVTIQQRNILRRKTLPFCACGCNNNVTHKRHKYIKGHQYKFIDYTKGYDRSKLDYNKINTKEVIEKRRQGIKNKISQLSEEEQHKRLLNSMHGKHVDHIKRGAKISESKKGKSTNQQEIMGKRYAAMSNEEFETYLKTKKPIVRNRMIKCRNKYLCQKK